MLHKLGGASAWTICSAGCVSVFYIAFTVRNIFHAIAAASGDKKHLKSKDLGDLCSALNDPIESEELPKVTKMLSDDNGLITFDKFLDFWSTEEEL